MLKTFETTVSHKISYKYELLEDYPDLVWVDGEFYFLNSFPKKLELGLRKICEDTSAVCKMPRKLKVKIPKGKKMYEKKVARPDFIYESEIEDFKKGGPKDFDKKPKGKRYIGINWTTMDGTMWLLGKDRLFHPIVSLEHIEFSTGVFGNYGLENIAKIAKKQSWYVSHSYYEAHCADCGGRTLVITYQHTEETADKALDNVGFFHSEPCFDELIQNTKDY